jgi:phosphotriesterase-related protein
MINSVLGPISPNDLGKTLIHEHITFGFAGWYANDAITPFDRRECVKVSLETMNELKTYGVRTFMDATPNDSGRNPELLKEISETSGVNIICSTGLYTEAEGGSAYFKFRAIHGDVEFEIYELFLKEIIQGIGSTGIKAGVIKVATGNGQITTYEKSVLKAAGRVQKETGVPIITHTVAGTMGPEQADILISAGADPKHIVIGHICSSADIKYHLTVLEKGVYIAFDRLGIESSQSDTVRKTCIIGLIAIGYADKIMLSHDSIVRWLGKPFISRTPTHVFKNIIPDLKKAGVTDDQINMMMVENPRRLFGGGISSP